MLTAFLIAIAPFIRVGMCESHMTNAINPAGFYGYWQDADPTWHSISGLPGHASDYSLLIQLEYNVKLQRERGWAPWTCGYLA